MYRIICIALVCIMFLVIFGVCLTYASPNAAFVENIYEYKTVNDKGITAIVYRADDNKIRPVVVWIHGGALIMGENNNIPNDIKELCQKEGYVLVSINYRLNPEVKLPQIIEDIKDAFKWIRQEGYGLFYCNPDKIVVSGGSAGGYLTMMTGICINPLPTALVAYYGYGDVDGHWYTNPSEHYRKNPLVIKDELFQNGKLKDRRRYYLYLRQNGLWTKEVTGFDPKKDRDKLTPYCPVRNITAQYPPILMIHGTNDTDVPYDCSFNMAVELENNNVPHMLITVPGAGHGFRDGDKNLVAAAKAAALEFIKQHLK